jgi:hypothetical protein
MVARPKHEQTERDGSDSPSAKLPHVYPAIRTCSPHDPDQARNQHRQAKERQGRKLREDSKGSRHAKAQGMFDVI